jgi:hypothetical protein
VLGRGLLVRVGDHLDAVVGPVVDQRRLVLEVEGGDGVGVADDEAEVGEGEFRLRRGCP